MSPFNWKIAVVLILLAIYPQLSEGVTITITTNTNWSAISPAPTTSDDVIVRDGATLTVDVTNAVSSTVTLGSTQLGGTDGTLAWSSTSDNLTVSYDCKIGDGGGSGTLDMTNAGWLTCGELADGSTGSATATLIAGTGTIELTASNSLIPPFTYNNMLLSFTTRLTGDIYLNGNLTIAAIGDLDITTTNNYSVSIEGNWTNNGLFLEKSGTVNFKGSGSQTITNTSGETFNGLVIDKTGGEVTLASSTSITISSFLTLTYGIIDAKTNSNSVIFEDGATSTSGNANSYITGEVTKIGDQIFAFPTGDGTKWARIGISAPLTASTKYTAQYFASAYADVTTLDAGSPTLNNVIRIEFWTLAQAVNDDDVQVTLYWEDDLRSGIDDCDGDPDDLRVAHWSGTEWEINVDGVIITGGCAGAPTAGMLQTNANQPLYSPFTFGSKGSGQNPLPIDLLYFDAEYNEKEEVVDLTWATASETNNDYFTIERSEDGIDFGAIGTVDGAGNSNAMLQYSFIDQAPNPLSYYRLKQTDYDGKFEYSNLIIVKIPSPLILSVGPNPTTNSIKVIYREAVKYPGYNVLISIYDINGQLIYEKNFDDTFYKVNIDISSFNQGLYFVTLNANNETYKAKFVKGSN